MIISIDAAKAFEKTQTHLGLKQKQTNKKNSPESCHRGTYMPQHNKCHI